jgi:hypothetical protein
MLVYIVFMLMAILLGMYLGWWLMMREEEREPLANPDSSARHRILLEVRAHKVDQFFSALPLIRSRLRTEHVVADVSFDHLIH